jgi:anti-sigma regulatory factor (Ser/Thr protein kinase)
MELRFPSENRYLHMVHQLTKNLAESTGFEAVEAEQIALAVDEAATNVIQHAYGGSLATRSRFISIPRGEPGYRDLPRRRASIPCRSGVRPRQARGREAQRGFGLTIMRQMMDKVEHGRAGTARTCASWSIQAEGSGRS